MYLIYVRSEHAEPIVLTGFRQWFSMTKMNFLENGVLLCPSGHAEQGAPSALTPSRIKAFGLKEAEIPTVTRIQPNAL